MMNYDETIREDLATGFSGKSATIRRAAQEFTDALCRMDFDVCNKMMYVGEFTPPDKMTGREKTLYDVTKKSYIDAGVTPELVNVRFNDDVAFANFAVPIKDTRRSEIVSVWMGNKNGKWLVYDFVE